MADILCNVLISRKDVARSDLHGKKCGKPAFVFYRARPILTMRDVMPDPTYHARCYSHDTLDDRLKINEEEYIVGTIMDS